MLDMLPKYKRLYFVLLNKYLRYIVLSVKCLQTFIFKEMVTFISWPILLKSIFFEGRKKPKKLSIWTERFCFVLSLRIEKQKAKNEKHFDCFDCFDLCTTLFEYLHWNTESENKVSEWGGGGGLNLGNGKT